MVTFSLSSSLTEKWSGLEGEGYSEYGRAGDVGEEGDVANNSDGVTGEQGDINEGGLQGVDDEDEDTIGAGQGAGMMALSDKRAF